ncbi:MAG: hypothetical protein M3680_21215, partial [Myxococcota bacterium]|nr:hypothetical protein [Myxococcota bacterium]
MTRLGELLVGDGLLTGEQVDQALRAQVMWGGRLGTNLIELGYLDLDKLAVALGRQHALPAALGRHFEQSEPALQRLLSAEFAERFSCVPLLRAGPGKAQVIVASTGPLEKKALAIVADELAIEPKHIVQSVAGELRIRYQLELVYKIPRGARFLRPRGKTIPPFPQFDIDPLVFEDSQVDNPIVTFKPVATPVPPPSAVRVPAAALDPLAPPALPRA